AGELVHPRGRRRSCRADDLFAHRIDRADVVDEAVFEIDRQFFAAIQHVRHALVRGVAAGEQLPAQQQHLSRLPGKNLFAGYGVEMNAARAGDVVSQLRPVFKRGWIEIDGTGAVEHEVRVARGGTVRNHGDGKIGGVGRIV